MEMTECSKRHLRLAIADDHPIVREGLESLIASQQDMEIISEAENGKQAIRQYFRYLPDVLLLDLRMPEMNGVEVTQAIRRRRPEAKIIVFSTYDGDEDVYRALMAGAKSYLLKDARREQLFEAIRSVHHGHFNIPSRIGELLAMRLAVPNLTKRETEVLHLIVQGKSNKEIGVQLQLATGTIKIHNGRLFKKLGAKSRTGAIRIAIERGIVSLDSPFAI